MRYSLFFCFFLCFVLLNTSFAQNQKLADSLIAQHQSGSYKGNELELLKAIAVQETNPITKEEYAIKLIEKATKDNQDQMLLSGYLQKGNALHLSGEVEQALEAYFESLRLSKQIQYDRGAGNATIAIANLYSEIGNSVNANKYYAEGIELLRKNDDPAPLSKALFNAGDEAFNAGDYTQALTYFKESGELFDQLDYTIGKAYNLGNIGMVYAEQRQDELAEANINQAVRLLEELEDYYGISVYLTYMSDIYARKNKFPLALNYAEKSLDLATRHGLKNQMSEAHLKLAELHEQNENPLIAFDHYKSHIAYRDSVKNIEVVQQMADQRTEFEVSQKQIEVDLLEQKRKNQRIVTIATALGLLAVGIFSIGLYRRNQFIRKTKKIIEAERDRSDTLLLNILPEETAEELKMTGKVSAKKYESTTVLFTDFKGFTSYSEGLSPEELVKTVSFYFSAFDEIIEKHGLEKIKTIGDAYMCAGGIHSLKNNHADKMLEAAFEIAEFVKATKKGSQDNKMTFDVRIGINSGPVVAGVVGTKKFAYDIWGDTVNVASRMESMSAPGKINISETTYALIKKDWNCEYRGEIEVKNRGRLKMYFVNN
ncbi:adenylate/guanylate cyclase domain-containing protein [Croceiramulus getboli]|nr:adenylate/guanylate cyclase domain-containing protein [Flavobacteriaceae bacterium YJPT1-3]